MSEETSLPLGGPWIWCRVEGDHFSRGSLSEALSAYDRGAMAIGQQIGNLRVIWDRKKKTYYKQKWPGDWKIAAHPQTETPQ